jgi:hypothetical protein
MVARRDRRGPAMECNATGPGRACNAPSARGCRAAEYERVDAVHGPPGSGHRVSLDEQDVVRGNLRRHVPLRVPKVGEELG